MWLTCSLQSLEPVLSAAEKCVANLKDNSKLNMAATVNKVYSSKFAVDFFERSNSYPLSQRKTVSRASLPDLLEANRDCKDHLKFGV